MEFSAALSKPPETEWSELRLTKCAGKPFDPPRSGTTIIHSSFFIIHFFHMSPGQRTPSPTGGRVLPLRAKKRQAASSRPAA